MIIGTGNPNKYSASDINKNLNKKYSEIWEKDKNRINLINEQHKIDIKVIWESDAKNKQIIDELINWVYTKNE